MGRSIERFVVEGMNHMEWDNEKEYVDMSPRYRSPLVQVGLSFDTDPEALSEEEHQVVAAVGQVRVYEGEGVC